MKKIPTLFKRVYENHRIVGLLPEVTDGMEWVLNGDGTATVKWDGACCAIINGELYRRYDAKNGKPIPDGAIKCQKKPDEITGHMPCWVKCGRDNPNDKWFWAAYDSTSIFGSIDEPIHVHKLNDGTYEAVGKHFQGNPYNLKGDQLIEHGKSVVEVERTFDGIKKFLSENYIEGIVFWKDNKPQCKIKRTDFGLEWNGKGKKMTTTQTADKIVINGKEVADFPKGRKSQSVTIINDKLFVNGYEYKNGTWKRTLQALWHLWV